MSIFSAIYAYFACRRMGLRDKGVAQPFTEDEERVVSICAFCKTRARIGIRESDNQVVKYCWRCETVLDTLGQACNAPKTPPKKDPGGDNDRKVIEFVKRD